MFARSILIAAAVALGAGSAAFAEPAKAPRPEPAGQQAAATPVLLASANVEHAAAAGVSAAAGDPAASPAKRPRRGRVTTCRCADTPNQ